MTAFSICEITPDTDCDCRGCELQRRDDRLRGWRHNAPTVKQAAALVALGGVSLAGLGSAQAHAAPSQQNAVTSLSVQNIAYAQQSRLASAPNVKRSEIIQRAQGWVNSRVPYSMYKYWRDGYRQDCSGLVSMAWKLGSNQWTGSLSSFAVRISKNELRPGDMLLYHNRSNPGAGSHVVIFGGWANSAKTKYTAYEQTRPHTLKRTVPYAYFNNSGSYVPYRYKNVVEDGSSGGGGGSSSVSFPGGGAFGAGKSNSHITRLGEMLSARGGARFYPNGTGPTWMDNQDREATRAFQKAQGWSGSDADGLPGAHTWQLLTSGAGADIPGGASGGGSSGGGGGSSSSSYPGGGAFGPGKSNSHITTLGKQLVKKGYGRHYTSGPGPSWSESDRRNVEAFQRAQGWTGKDADGYPGPETWRRLFG